ncbi:hypothetical protein K432DRAFT_399221 [Lepidopterella palustris CBS 459.81]|uniref:Uncharacterized protein n=1 Tax=Lepidopterella palustris CBS 459.81 TaxID=1314670 RepID=A0A8E2DWD0_9PEZI|nr:hypothetical protein K432DRAFT_399221 [Lepidopterella palustris CBS 459.81]
MASMGEKSPWWRVMPTLSSKTDRADTDRNPKLTSAVLGRKASYRPEGLVSSSRPRIVLHGLEATGKSLISRKILKTIGVAHAIVDSRECITGRHLLEQAIGIAANAIGSQYTMP